MRFANRRKMKQWLRYGLKWGLILTDAKLLEAIGSDVMHAAHSVSGRLNTQLQDRPPRRAPIVVQRRPDWAGRAFMLAGGIGLGIGVAFLMAQNSGDATRDHLRSRATAFRNRMSGVETPFRSSATGTTGS
jgi:hypothetical protein